MRLLAIIFVLALSLFAAPVGTLVSLTGGARLFTKGVVAPTTAEAGMALQVGQTLKTRLASKANVKLTDNTKIIVGPNSALELIEEKKIAATGPKILFKVSKQTDTKGLTITTPSAIIGVRGTTFLVSSEGDHQTIYLKEGELSIKPWKGQFKSYLESMQAEFAEYAKEFDEYKANIMKEYAHYVDEVTMKGGMAISIDGNNVRATKITPEIEAAFQELEKF
ncbi:MAG: FecR family protein [Campylobacterales bacterium]